MNLSLFPLAEYWWFYLVFTGFVLVLLAIDLGVFHREAHTVSMGVPRLAANHTAALR